MKKIIKVIFVIANIILIIMFVKAFIDYDPAAEGGRYYNYKGDGSPSTTHYYKFDK